MVKSSRNAAGGTHACMQSRLNIWQGMPWYPKQTSSGCLLEDCGKLQSSGSNPGLLIGMKEAISNAGTKCEKRERKDITCIGLRELQKTL